MFGPNPTTCMGGYGGEPCGDNEPDGEEGPDNIIIQPSNFWSDPRTVALLVAIGILGIALLLATIIAIR